MYKDFKENYIEQQKQQAAARQARLAKIGMGGSSVANAKRAKPESEKSATAARAPQRTAPATRPVTRPATQTRPQTASATRPAQRPANAQTQRPQSTNTATSASRPAAQAQRRVQPVEQPARRAASEGNGTTVAAYEQRRAATKTAYEQRGAVQPERKVSSESTTANTTASRPSRPESAPARPVQKPSQTAQRTSQSASSYHSYQRRRPAPTESDIFKKELSEDESRAMMFGLTGRAEKPDDGGDVDIINMGRISAPKKKREEVRRRSKVGSYIGRTFLSLASVLLFVVIAVFSTVGIVAIGPSETIRDLLVLSAEHSSAAKWVPYVFLPAETVESIINKSEEVVQDVVSMDDYNAGNDSQNSEDEWANAKDGMIFETVSGSTFKAYVLLVKDSSRVFVGTSEESLAGAPKGDDIFHITKFYGAVAAINGGEFPDYGGGGTGHTPIGLTYSKGKCVYNDGHTDRTFLGITKDNRLIVNEGMTQKRADELGIRDAVSFQKGNTLIQQNGDQLVFHYQDGNTGTAQRTGIGQRADGTMILVVTDGRSASSLGATHNDMIDLMVSYGAVSAGLLDGGSSAMMYYEDYYTKYGYDTSKLDEYQKMGLVNNYKAFTEPRKIPTFFIVNPE